MARDPVNRKGQVRRRSQANAHGKAPRKQTRKNLLMVRCVCALAHGIQSPSTYGGSRGHLVEWSWLRSISSTKRDEEASSFVLQVQAIRLCVKRAGASAAMGARAMAGST